MSLKILKKFLKINHKKGDCVIFSDSLSVLRILKEQNYTTKATRDLAVQISSFIRTFDLNLTLQWIPSHCGIPGNERADYLAKKGAAKTQQDKPVSQATVKQIIKSNNKIEWYNKWAQNDKGRVMYHHIPKPNKIDPINSLERKDQVVIFRLRTNHIQLNAHLNRILKDHQPACPLCGYREETVHHFLFECPPLQDIRSQFLPPNPNRENTLYAPLLQLKNTSSYFHKANHRRTRVQD